MKYRVTVEVEVDEEDPLTALYSEFDPEDDSISVIQIRQEPFDVPSPMWDVSTSRNGYELRRLR